MELLSAELNRRLNDCRTYSCHDPMPHPCPPNCTKTVICREPTWYAIEPLKLYEEVKNQEFKKSLRTHLNKKVSVKLDYLYLTINPKPSIKFKDFQKKIQRTLQSKLFADHLAVYEQRGTPEKDLGRGFHAHILFKRHTPLNEGLPPTNLKRNLKDSYKNICDTSNPEIFNIQFIGQDFARDKKEYILGVKTAEGKAEKQTGDSQWRLDNSIEPYYGNSQIV